jgi:SAM-dependent MidA family methyltransferase
MHSIDMPPPSGEALEVSQHLGSILRRRIQREGGWISFEQYMQMALYEPILGYYAGGSRKFGAAGDFTTGPEITPLFGACLATQIAQWFAVLPHQIVEFGGGTGVLAVQILNELERLGFRNVRYDIVELSSELRERQLQTLRMFAPLLLDQVRWLDEMPSNLQGVVIGNELLDALPVRLFKLQDGRIIERGVALAGGNTDALAGDLQWQDRPADDQFAREVRQRLAQADWPLELNRVTGNSDYVSEYSPIVQAWVSTMVSQLERGVALLIDYGFPVREYYHAQRDQGTLMCHYRHRAHADPFFAPGLSDITAHVDFSLVASVAAESGASLLGYSSQARFLLNCGLLDRLARFDVNDRVLYGKQAQAVQLLLSEAEMGELFKVIALGKGVSDDAIGFVSGDRRAALID